jgi:hypothetical protein
MVSIIDASFEIFSEADTTINLDTRLSGLFPERRVGGVCMPRRAWKHIPNDQHPAIVRVSYAEADDPKILVSAFNDIGQPVEPERGRFLVSANGIEIGFDGANLQAMRSGIQDALVLLRAERTAHPSTHRPLSVSISKLSLIAK